MNGIEMALEVFARGELVVVLDDAERENEGDLVCAAEDITSEKVNFMLTYGRGLLCAPLSAQITEKLELAQMVNSNTEKHHTAFTVSVDAKENTDTGISAADRATTIRLLANNNAGHNDFVYPGHVFPLKAKKGGIRSRPGHTEASIELAKLAGKAEAAAICEILSSDGSMARKNELTAFAKKHKVPIITIADLLTYIS